jgi:hypothetical protein
MAQRFDEQQNSPERIGAVVQQYCWFILSYCPGGCVGGAVMYGLDVPLGDPAGLAEGLALLVDSALA